MKQYIIIFFISFFSIANTYAQTKNNQAIIYPLNEERYELFKEAIIESIDFEIEVLLENKKANLMIPTRYLKERLSMKHTIVFLDEIYKAVAKVIVADEMLQDELIDKIVAILEEKKPKNDKAFKAYYKANEAYFSRVSNEEYDGLLFMFMQDYFKFNTFYSNYSNYPK